MENEQRNQADDAANDTLATLAEIEALKKCLESETGDYTNKGRKNKKGAILIQILLVLLSALTTIFIGWKPEDNKSNVFLINLGLICSAVVAGLNVTNAFFDYRELWAQYNVSRNQLRMLLSELSILQASGDGNVTKKQLTEIFERYRGICDETNKTYQQLRMAKDSTEG